MHQSMYSFYNEITYIQFATELLSKLVSTSNDECWETKPLKTHGIEIQSTLFPKW